METSLLSTHITALEFLGSRLLIGEGNVLYVYDPAKKSIIIEEKILKGSAIHGIRQLSAPGGDITSESGIAVFGGTALIIVSLNTKGVSCSLQIVQPQHNFTEWIWDVSHVCSLQRDDDHPKKALLILALAHNTLLVWDYINRVVYHRVECSEKCILYSALLLENKWPHGIMLAAGTVFKEVLIWGIEGPKDSMNRIIPFHRLVGHEGVIFSITYSHKLQLLATTSDDRSLRLWKFHKPTDTVEATCTNSDSSRMVLEVWKNGKFDILHVLYGHQSRVWMSRILEKCVITIGEDSNMCVWTYDGVLVRKEKCGGCGSIWSLAVDSEEALAVTGGSDGGVLMWKISELLDTTTLPAKTPCFQTPSSIDLSNGKDAPSNVILVNSYDNETNVLMITRMGCLYMYEKQCWTLLFQDTSLTSYNVMAATPNRDLVAVGNLHGQVQFLKNTDSGWQIVMKQDIHDGKIHSLIWMFSHSELLLLSCGPKGQMKLWRLEKCTKNELEIKEINSYQLMPSKQQWPSAATITSSYHHLVVGDRVGSLHIYLNCQARNTACESADQSFLGIHGKNGVTDVKENLHHVYTSGRDGRILVHLVLKDRLQILQAIKMPRELEWISRLCFVDNNLFILGFHTTKFLLWGNAFSRTLMEIECGGGHRSWDFAFSSSSMDGVFVYIRQNDIFCCRHPFAFILKHSIVKFGLHSKKIWRVCSLFSITHPSSGCTTAYLATGGEDNRILIHALNYHYSCDSRPKAKIVSTLTSHISSVRALASCSLCEDKCLLVSAGGRAQMMVWKIGITEGELIVSQVANHFLWSVDKPYRKPWENKGNRNIISDPQTRYMDVSIWKSQCKDQSDDSYFIATACSDALLRLFVLTLSDCQIHLLQIVPHGNHCTLRLLHFGKHERDAILTGANDGRVNLWKMDKTNLQVICKKTRDLQLDGQNSWKQDIKNLIPSTVSSATNLCDDLPLMHPVSQLALHQSGINAVDLFCLQDANKWLLCTGGDDNSLSICILQFIDDLSVVMKLAECKKTNAHAAMITGVKCLTENFVVTASIDQRICYWQIKHSSESNIIDIMLHSQNLTSVPDVAHLEVLDSRNKWTIIVCGEGLEVFYKAKFS